MSNIQDLNQNLYDKYDARYMSEIDNVKKTIGYSKNLLPYPYYHKNLSYGGITITDNGDGILTVNGTATQDIFFVLGNPITFLKGKYILSGCPSGGSESTYSIYVESSEGLLMFDTGNGVNFTLSKTTDVAFGIRIKSGTTLSNKVFKPMVRYASVTDDTYEPYVNNRKNWTVLANGCKSCNISVIPDNVEIYVLVTFKESEWVDAVEFNLHKQIINLSGSDYRYYTKGSYVNSNYNFNIRIGVNNENITLNQANLNGASCYDNTWLYIFYR